MPIPLHVLLLEDNPSDAELMLVELRRAGFEPHWQRMETEPDFLAALDPALDLILADYHLPQFDGVRALRLMQEHGFEIPFILVSGTVGEETAVEAMQQGAADYVIKDRMARLGQAAQRALQARVSREERLRAESALKESEAALRGMMVNSPDSIYVVDLTTHQSVYFHESFLGYTRGELTAPGGVLFAVHPEDQDAVRASWQQLIGSPDDRVHDIEYRFQAKDGTWEWIHSRSSVIARAEDGTPARVMVTLSVISPRKRVDAALRESENRLRSLFAAMTDVVVIYDADGRYLEIAPTNPMNLSRPPSELLGRTVTELFPPDLADFVLDHIRQSLKSRRLEYVEYQLPFGDQARWFSAAVSPLSSNSVLWVAHDITNRKQAETALHESEERFRALIENSSDAITLLDAQGRAGHESPRASSMLGYARDEWLGKDVYQLVHPDDLPAIRGFFQEHAKTPGTHPVRTFRLRHQSGSWLWIEAVATNMFAEPAVKAMVVNFRDITERMQAEKASRTLAVRSSLAKAAGSIGIWDWDLVKNELVWDDRMYEMYGVSAESFSGAYDAWQKGVHPDDLARADAEVQASIRNHQRFYSEFRISKPDGQIRHIEAHAQVIYAKNDEPLRMIGINTDITERKQAQAKIQRQLKQLIAVSEIDRAISSSLDLHLSLSTVLTHVTHELEVDAADILVLNTVTQTLEYAAGSGFRTDVLQHTRLPLGQGCAGLAAVERRTIHVADLRKSDTEILRAPNFTSEDFETYMGLPLIAKGKLLGVLEVFHRSPYQPDPERQDFLNTLAGQAAIAIDSVTQFESVQRSNVDLSLAYDATIAGWSHALDLRDKETEGHTERVTELCLDLARRFGLQDEELVHVRRGALLHDIGKMGVPDGILLKPGPLTDEEWVVMRSHPVFAYEMLAPIRYLHAALDIPYCHHEKWDGTGYPRGLKGEQIPLSARIFAVIDVWDALTSDRPYRKAWTIEKALEHIRAGAGTHFDPQVVKVLLESDVVQTS